MDVTRATLYVLLPLCLIYAVFLVAQGVPQNFLPYTQVTTLEGAKQTIAQGPVASQEAIKMLGTNGGGFGTEAQIGDLPIVPRKKIEYRGATFEDMDTDAILARHPHTVVVDELAHTNVPGSAREKRWQDVDVLLDAHINVLSTLNVQHLESLNDPCMRSRACAFGKPCPITFCAKPTKS